MVRAIRSTRETSWAHKLAAGVPGQDALSVHYADPPHRSTSISNAPRMSVVPS